MRVFKLNALFSSRYEILALKKPRFEYSFLKERLLLKSSSLKFDPFENILKVFIDSEEMIFFKYFVDKALFP